MKRLLSLLLTLILCLGLLVGCQERGIPIPPDSAPDPALSEPSPEPLPPDFAFSIVWDVYGISSYDSSTGKLIKENDVDNVEDYTADLTLSEADLKKVCGWLCTDIDLWQYPDEYDPFNAPDADFRKMSTPSQDIVLSVTANGQTKTVTCNDVMIGTEEDGYCREAKAFLRARTQIIRLLKAQPEWQELPEYDHMFE